MDSSEQTVEQTEEQTVAAVDMGKTKVEEPPRRLPPVSPPGGFDSFTVVEGVVFFEYSDFNAMKRDGHNKSKKTFQNATTQTEETGPGKSIKSPMTDKSIFFKFP